MIARKFNRCYAMRLAGTRLRDHPSRSGLTIQTKTGPVWNGEVKANEKALLQPLHWKKPRLIFWNAHGDLFYERVPYEWIVKNFAVAILTPQHTHQILTKRTDRMRDVVMHPDFRPDILDAASHLARDWKENARAVWHAEQWPPKNIWLGTSIEDRTRMLERAPVLAEIDWPVKFWSAEPLIGGLGLIPPKWFPNWVIVGGESGPGFRPMQEQWVSDIIDQGRGYGKAVFVKQMAGKVPIPEHLQVREWPV